MRPKLAELLRLKNPWPCSCAKTLKEQEGFHLQTAAYNRALLEEISKGFEDDPFWRLPEGKGGSYLEGVSFSGNNTTCSGYSLRFPNPYWTYPSARQRQYAAIEGV